MNSSCDFLQHRFCPNSPLLTSRPSLYRAIVGLCAAHCPVQAIDSSDVRKTDAEKCISCMRCAALCPQKARQADPQALSAVDEHLKEVCALRKEPELYI